MFQARLDAKDFKSMLENFPEARRVSDVYLVRIGISSKRLTGVLNTL